MRLPINFIICVCLVQITSSCSAPLSEQCKQLKSVQDAYTEIKEPLSSKYHEIASEQTSKKSKDIAKLWILDSSLKEIQKKFVRNYDDQANNHQILFNIQKQIELLDTVYPSSEYSAKMQKAQKLLDLVQQSDKPRDEEMILLKEVESIKEDMNKLCST